MGTDDDGGGVLLGVGVLVLAAEWVACGASRGTISTATTDLGLGRDLVMAVALARCLRRAPWPSSRSDTLAHAAERTRERERAGSVRGDPRRRSGDGGRRACRGRHFASGLVVVTSSSSSSRGLRPASPMSARLAPGSSPGRVTRGSPRSGSGWPARCSSGSRGRACPAAPLPCRPHALLFVLAMTSAALTVLAWRSPDRGGYPHTAGKPARITRYERVAGVAGLVARESRLRVFAPRRAPPLARAWTASASSSRSARPSSVARSTSRPGSRRPPSSRRRACTSSLSTRSRASSTGPGPTSCSVSGSTPCANRLRCLRATARRDDAQPRRAGEGERDLRACLLPHPGHVVLGDVDDDGQGDAPAPHARPGEGLGHVGDFTCAAPAYRTAAFYHSRESPTSTPTASTTFDKSGLGFEQRSVAFKSAEERVEEVSDYPEERGDSPSRSSSGRTSTSRTSRT